MNKRFNDKILIVDDDPKNLQVAMTILKDYSLVYAQSAKKALEHIQNNKFDLILLDVVMPDINGYELCEQLKASKEYKDIPIIFLTVKDEEKDIVKGFDLGAVDYVTKPFFRHVLLKRVETQLRLSRTMSELNTLNKNLEFQVEKQIDELRRKDMIINQQNKIEAMADVINVITHQWKKPLDLLKLYLQSVSFNLNNLNDETFSHFTNALNEVNKLETIIDDFNKIFNSNGSRESVNIKVTLDNAIFKNRYDLDRNGIKLKVEGCNLCSLNTVYDEIKYIFEKLIANSVTNFCSYDCEDKNILIKIEDNNQFVTIEYLDNCLKNNFEDIEKLLATPSVFDYETFNLGIYLIKIFVQKNAGIIKVEKRNNGIKYIVKFNK